MQGTDCQEPGPCPRSAHSPPAAQLRAVVLTAQTPFFLALNPWAQSKAHQLLRSAPINQALTEQQLSNFLKTPGSSPPQRARPYMRTSSQGGSDCGEIRGGSCGPLGPHGGWVFCPLGVFHISESTPTIIPFSSPFKSKVYKCATGRFVRENQNQPS